MTTPIRTFIGIPLGVVFKEHITALQTNLKQARCRISFTKPELVHVTIHFFGDVVPEQSTDIERCLHEAVRGHAPFSLGMEGVGAFPNARKPRVIWAGLTGDLDRLVALKRSVDQAICGIGFTPEERPFSPHVTIGRVKGTLGTFGDSPQRNCPLEHLLQSCSIHTTATVTVREMILFRSDLSASGPTYTALATIPLE